ncbi:hypothetical protein VCRA2119O147_690011 [Vibrio crassostreae]|nr:hypothetical protein VCHA34P114_160041 [Vibrio chagasii]CAK1813139.1 hypothetical protein VCRA2113O322_180045 [Vibrio crassostreae]CAH6823718.1 hypothetical protein VCHA32P90_180037 [Vibrio chagasii]CAH6827172.1 hypothetical protein VCHA35O137_180037 [Vibrio chagasii]CAH6829617.1 hypothetical protein VCHA36O157_190044 [Vibrio chagasii]
MGTNYAKCSIDTTVYKSTIVTKPNTESSNFLKIICHYCFTM